METAVDRKEEQEEDKKDAHCIEAPKLRGVTEQEKEKKPTGKQEKKKKDNSRHVECIIALHTMYVYNIKARFHVRWVRMEGEGNIGGRSRKDSAPDARSRIAIPIRHHDAYITQVVMVYCS